MVRQGLFQMDSVRLGLTKWALIVFNMVFWVMGVVSLGIGMWLYITQNEFATFTSGHHLLGSVFLVATGFGVVIVGFLGILAALWESRIIATVFCVLTVLAMGLYVASGGWALWLKPRLSQDLRTSMLGSISEYDTVSAYRQNWDSLHTRYECCGVDDVRDWEERRNPLIPLPPRSCCQEEQSCPVFYAKGCLADLENYETRQLDIIAPIALAFGAFQIVGVVVSVVFCCVLKPTKGSYYT